MSGRQKPSAGGNATRTRSSSPRNRSNGAHDNGRTTHRAETAEEPTHTAEPNVAFDAAGRIEVITAHRDGSPAEATLESLWFRLVEQGVTTIAIVPVADLTGADALDVARRLALVSADATESGEAIVIDATGIDRSQVRPMLTAIQREGAHSESNPRCVATDPATESAAAVAVSQSCHQVVLLIGLTQSTTDDLATTIDAIGSHRVAAAVCAPAPAPARRSRLARLLGR